ncbi:hypothetical protein F383_38540 [Gossypium arboreum]|jgi:hypothetical protein
MYTY